MKPVNCLLLLVFLLLASCGPQATPTPEIGPAPVEPPATDAPLYLDASQPVETRVEDLLARMSLDEKIGQMTQVEKNSIRSGDITRYYIGSILSGGGGSPPNNNPLAWAEMVTGFQDEALATPLAIPMIYGVDATHGHGNLLDATIFPQQIGQGAARDPDLVERIGRATALEMLATGVPWTFSPLVSVTQDIRWGRTFETYSEETSLVGELGAAYIRGLQSLPEDYQASPGQTLFTLATPKHYLGDGGTIWGSSRTGSYLLDQGNMQVDEAAVRQVHLPPYAAALNAGAMNVMVSFSSWRGTKMHAEEYLLTDVLKDELGFQGFLVSDWGGIDQIEPGNYYRSVVASINAGVDMNMVPYDYVRFITTMKQAVEQGDISQERIDDAVRRILRVKFTLGLFEHPYPDPAYIQTVRSAAHLELARQAVRQSLVLLKNDASALPINKNAASIFVAGDGAENIGMQCGGWTIEWQGRSGNITAGTTILAAVRAAVSSDTRVEYDKFGRFDGRAEVGIVVVGEQPYAEGFGDKADLRLAASDVGMLNRMRDQVDRLVVVILSGRPLVITDQYQTADAWVAAWQPGTEGAGITDVLFGDYPFVGKLPFTWPRTNEQLPINVNNSAGLTGCDAPLFPFGFGLGEAGSQPVEWLDCP